MCYVRERWRLLLVLAVFTTCLWAGGLAGLITYVNRRGCVSMANYHRIREGMSRANVEALLGGTGGPAPVLFRLARLLAEESRPYELKRPYIAEQWVDGRLSITVHFDQNDKVESASWMRDVPPPWWQIMLVQLKLLP